MTSFLRTRSIVNHSFLLPLLAVLAMLGACSEQQSGSDANMTGTTDTSTTAAQTSADVASVTTEQQAAEADFSGLNPGWNVFEPGGDTVCSDGSDYRFYVKQGDADKFMFYLEGGGACWDGANCDPDLQPSYQVNLAATDPGQMHGILAFDHPQNPVADYTVVYAPYCSGDVHLGDTEQHYEAPTLEGHAGHSVHIRHRGMANASAAMDWALENLSAPNRIFVTGSSAGSIPSPFYAMQLAGHYPQAAVVQLGDASGGYRGFANFSPYDVWETNRVVQDMTYIRDIPAEQFGFHHLYLAAAQANPRIRLASYDNAEDEVQLQFLALGGTPTTELRPLLETNLQEISEAVPDFRYYVAGGTMHTILLRPEVYSYEVAGVRFVDWLDGLVNGEEITNVMCVECNMAPEPVQTP